MSLACVLPVHIPVASSKNAPTAPQGGAAAAAGHLIAGLNKSPVAPCPQSPRSPRSISPPVADENETSQNRETFSGLRISGLRAERDKRPREKHAENPSSTFSALGATIGSPPRHVIIRSLVQMQRSAYGDTSRVFPSEDRIKAGRFESTAGPGGIAHSKSNRQLRIAGSGPEKVPVELVTCPNFRPSRLDPVKQIRRRTSHARVTGNLFGVSWHSDGYFSKFASESGGKEVEAIDPAVAAAPPSPNTFRRKNFSPVGSPRGEASHASSPRVGFRKKEVIVLTHELRSDLKTQLDNLAVHGSPDFFNRTPSKSTARTLPVFFKCLQNICEMLGAPLAEKAYRSVYSYELLQALANLWEPGINELFVVELSGSSGRLPSFGYLAFTVLVALREVPWTFTYNSLTHKICTCKVAFPGTTKCLVASDGHPGEALDSRTVANLASDVAARAPGTSLNIRALYARIDAFRRQERHFPAKLKDLAAALSEHFLGLSRIVPLLVEEFDELPLSDDWVLSQKWERFVGHFVSEVSVFDRVYTMFEKLCLELAERMIGIALEPVKGMTAPSSSLVCKPGDPFKPFETAVLCQRLGFLNQQVNFGGPHHLVHFDPDVLNKAQRVMMMSTYAEVGNMAQAMLTQFNSLCIVLTKLTESQIQPELQDNKELREAVVSLEAIWAECQFVLQQDILNFIQLFLDYSPRLSAFFRSRLYLAMHSEESASASQDAQDNARKTLFETLPILMYLDELWRDIRVQRGEIVKDPGGYSGCAFRDLFCPKSERHNLLRRDFAKFDEQRFAKFRSFCLGDLEEDAEGGHLQARYFLNVYRQLREVVAFPTSESPSEAMRVATRMQTKFWMEAQFAAGDQTDARDKFMRQEKMQAAEARAKWICVQRVAHTVDPGLFDGSEAAQTGMGDSEKDAPELQLRVDEVEMLLPVDSPASGASRRQSQSRRLSKSQEIPREAPKESCSPHEDAPPGSGGASPIPPSGAPPEGRKPRGRQSLARAAK